jgi:hypothetical protein
MISRQLKRMEGLGMGDVIHEKLKAKAAQTLESIVLEGDSTRPPFGFIKDELTEYIIGVDLSKSEDQSVITRIDKDGGITHELRHTYRKDEQEERT